MGLFAGLALDIAYTAAFLVLGIRLWLLLRRAALAGATVAVAGPGGRAGRGGAGAGVGRRAWLGELFQAGRAPDSSNGIRRARCSFGRADRRAGWSWLTPLVLLLCVVGLVLACRRAYSRVESGWMLLVALSLPAPVAVFVEHAFADRVQRQLARRSSIRRRWSPRRGWRRGDGAGCMARRCCWGWR